MINFKDLVKVTDTRASSVIDLTLNTEKDTITIGARIQALLGTMAFGIGQDDNDVILYIDPNGKVYPQKYYKTGERAGEAMTRGGSFTSAVLSSLLQNSYPNVTQFDLVDEEMVGWDHPGFRLRAHGDTPSMVAEDLGSVRDQEDEPAVLVGTEVSEETVSAPDTTAPYDI